MIRVLLVDDQTMIRAGLRSIIEGESGMVVVAESSNGSDGVLAAATHRPDVVVMDLRMPVLDGIAATRAIRADERLVDVRILVLTTFDADRDVLGAVGAGADGFLSKAADPDDLLAAIRSVAAGEVSLPQAALQAVLGAVRNSSAHAAKQTPDPVLADRLLMLTVREREILKVAAMGRTNEEIGAKLFISPLTVKTHLNRAMLKLSARDRGQLVAMAHLSGLLAEG